MPPNDARFFYKQTFFCINKKNVVSRGSDKAFGATLFQSSRLYARGYLFEYATLRFYANHPERNGSDEECQRKRVQHVCAKAILEHETHHRWREERAHAADAEEPSDGRRAKGGWI